jgi:hypothetical protein
MERKVGSKHKHFTASWESQPKKKAGSLIYE